MEMEGRRRSGWRGCGAGVCGCCLLFAVTSGAEMSLSLGACVRLARVYSKEGLQAKQRVLDWWSVGCSA